MSFTFKVNRIYDTSALAFWDFIATLIAAGWTKVKDSDGITYSSSGAQVTDGGSGAHGFDNGYAWVVLQYPGATRQICIQRDNGGAGYFYAARIKYSYAGFTTGSPSATQVPSAPDELLFYGYGTDAAPGMSVIHNANNRQARVHFCVGGRDERYAFYWMAQMYQQGNGGVFFFDPMAIGSFNAADPDPFVIGVEAGTYYLYKSPGTTNIVAYMGTPVPQTFGNDSVGLPTFAYSGADVAGNYMPNHVSGKDHVIPVVWGRRGANWFGNSCKGHSTLFMFTTVPRSFGMVMDYLGAGDRVHIARMLFPWPGRVPFMCH